MFTLFVFFFFFENEDTFKKPIILEYFINTFLMENSILNPFFTQIILINGA